MLLKCLKILFFSLSLFKNLKQKGLSPSGSDGSVFATIWGALLSVLQYIVMILASIKNSIFGGTAPSSQTQSKKR